MEVGLSPEDFVRWGPTPPQKGGGDHSNFSPMFIVALWPNGLMDPDGTWHGGRTQPRRLCVRWGPSFSLPKKGAKPPPIFSPCLLWPNSWMDQDGTWHGGGPWSRPHCVIWGPSSPSPKQRAEPPQFSAHFYCGQTAR